MLQESPKQRGITKTKAGKKASKKVVYHKSRTKREAKGEPQSNPLSYPQPIAYNY